jgi:methylenetetrahydrofolate dehydrogenase (NADP+)/methenyltetrahydrofolate cyclohydrolase
MPAQLLDGKLAAAEIRKETTARIDALSSPPRLGILVAEGDRPSAAYAKVLRRRGGKLGLEVQRHRYPDDIDQRDFNALLAEVEEGAHGVLVMRPLPRQLDPAVVDELIDPQKDVDGVQPANVGLLALGRPRFVPATARAMHLLLQRSGVPLKGKRAVIIGRSPTVGKPLFQLLLAEHLTVTVCHSRTVDLAARAAEADVLAVAVGRAHLVTPEFIKPGAVVLDAGYNWDTDAGHELGDVHPAAAETAGWFTPVPGGVGPLTTELMLANAVAAAELQQ